MSVKVAQLVVPQLSINCPGIKVLLPIIQYKNKPTGINGFSDYTLLGNVWDTG